MRVAKAPDRKGTQGPDRGRRHTSTQTTRIKGNGGGKKAGRTLKERGPKIAIREGVRSMGLKQFKGKGEDTVVAMSVSSRPDQGLHAGGRSC